MYRKQPVPLYPPRDVLQRTTTTPLTVIGEGLFCSEGSSPETQPQEQNTLEFIIFQEPLGNLLHISHIPEYLICLSTEIINGTLGIVSYGSYMV